MSCTLVQFWGSVPCRLRADDCNRNSYFHNTRKLRDSGEGTAIGSLAQKQRPLSFGWCVGAPER